MVRWDAMKVLSNAKTPAARAALLYALRNDTSSDVRRQATHGLGNYDDDEVVLQLIQLLADSDPGVVVAAYRSLQRVSGLNLGTRPAQWQEWFDSREGSSAAPEPAAAPVASPEPGIPPSQTTPASNPTDEDLLKRFRR
jgi:hypothetical protein